MAGRTVIGLAVDATIDAPAFSVLAPGIRAEPPVPESATPLSSDVGLDAVIPCSHASFADCSESGFGTGVNRFFAPQPMLALVVLRIGLGALVFFSYASKSPHVQSIYGPEGLGGARFHERVAGVAPGRALEASAHWLHGLVSADLIWVLYGTLLVTSLAFALGAFTRVTGTIALVLHTLFHAHNFTATLGWAVMLKSFWICALLAPTGRFASVDSWLSRRNATDAGKRASIGEWRGPGWPLRMVQMQVCAMYAVNWLRLDDAGWLKGAMVLVAVEDRWYGRFDFDWFVFRPLLALLSQGTLLLELLAPIALWIPGLGAFWALGLIAMHANLEFFANVGWWQPLMILALLTFVPVRWLAAWVEWPWVRLRAGRAAA
jgi:hypothetical protein